jgi:hypothetical protein
LGEIITDLSNKIITDFGTHKNNKTIYKSNNKSNIAIIFV